MRAQFFIPEMFSPKNTQPVIVDIPKQAWSVFLVAWSLLWGTF
jgi:hypothetical protein